MAAPREKRVASAYKGRAINPDNGIAQERSQNATLHTFPAPLRGLVLNENVTQVQPGGALVLDNWIPTLRGIRARGGCVRHATVAAGVTSLFTYKSGGTEKLFAATASAIYDVTSPASPTVSPSATISGQTAGYYSTTQFGTAGGDFLYIVNGSDDAQLYDGSTWQAVNGSSSPVSITGVSTDALSAVWSHASRLWFVEAGTMTAWYLPADSLGGAAASFSLAGVFRRGGSLLFGARWSLDAGDGLDDKCVFVSTEGEIAVYEGTNPGSASSWSLVGVYQMPRPLGINGHTSAGGNLLIATDVGLVPISGALTNDIAAFDAISVSSAISPLWQELASSITSKTWEIVKVPSQNVLYVSLPDSNVNAMLCLHLQTKAWSRVTGWNATCVASFAALPYYGDGSGGIFLMDASGSDDGLTYTCRMLGQFDPMGQYGTVKSLRLMRAVFEASSPINELLTAKADFDTTPSSPPNAPPAYTEDTWDVGLWDVALWDAGAATETRAEWVSTGVTGRFIAPEIQLTFGATPAPRVELVAIDAMFSSGAIVT